MFVSRKRLAALEAAADAAQKAAATAQRTANGAMNVAATAQALAGHVFDRVKPVHFGNHHAPTDKDRAAPGSIWFADGDAAGPYLQCGTYDVPDWQLQKTGRDEI